MINLPSGTEQGLWFTKNVSTNGVPWTKHYIIAHNDEILFRVYSKPDGVFVGNIAYDKGAEVGIKYGDKVAEKITKGYAKVASWHSKNEIWVPKSAPILPFPALVGRHRMVDETLLSRVEFKFKPKVDYQITVRLIRTAGGLFRLDQTESSQPPIHRGLPLWQTLFSDEGKAREVLRNVVEMKTIEGFVAYNHPPISQRRNGLAEKYPLLAKTAEALSNLGNEVVWF